ncbi:hypothetical protein F751_6978 [Auxenochlorella protothecoides]|uniref:Uncharacterized protein n=1 Tax=Auxenochlorella protothecoides TaxID=3075 RepID=A0A087SR57_AUXPR|nr:hypothetical protein F751_6978 [Auxenochlorella protothecoides]KFM28211.1 hypothetical protein F751_6978 [Auxenochlorella protothecoides]
MTGAVIPIFSLCTTSIATGEVMDTFSAPSRSTALFFPKMNPATCLKPEPIAMFMSQPSSVT